MTPLLFAPNFVEGAAMVGALFFLLVGIALIRRRLDGNRRMSPEERRARLAQRQKEREELPPGQN